MNKTVLTLLVSGMVAASAHAATTKWAVIFKRTQPVPHSPKTLAWCQKHTPTALVTTPAEIKGKGIMSLNQIWVRYRHYKIYNHGNKNLSFSIAYAVFSGKETDKTTWKLNTNIYEQGFSQATFFNAVWANRYCRGFLYGYPTKVD